MMFNGVALTEPCSKPHGKKREVNYGTPKRPAMATVFDTCYTCGSRDGTPHEVLTEAGTELLQFIKDWGKFATEDHGHSF